MLANKEREISSTYKNTKTVDSENFNDKFQEQRLLLNINGTEHSEVNPYQ